jgi:hypothetical protein
MKRVLKFIIQAITTMDGRRGTAEKMLDLMNRQSFDEYQCCNGVTIVPDSVRRNLVQKNEHILYRKVYMKYLILKVRAKISYMAFIKKMTVIELFATTIINSYNTMKAEGIICDEFPEEEAK